MIDANLTFKRWLESSPTIVALAAGGIFAAVLPEDYDPSQGRAIVVHTRGGSADLYTPLVQPSIQVDIWAPAGDYQGARELYRALFDLCHGAERVDLGADGFILAAWEQVQGQDITDPDTGWASVTTYFEVILRATA